MSELLKIEYHPKSGIAAKTIPFSEGIPSLHIDVKPPLEFFTEPWAPFSTKADFEFAELVTKDNLSANSIEAHIKLHKQSPQPAISFKGYDQFQMKLNETRKLLTGV
jgi:hypothetical protein